MRADAFVSDYVMKDTTRNQKKESAVLYEQIFNIHSTTREVFKKSLAFYEDHPELLKPIADSLRADEKKAQEYPTSTMKVTPDTTLDKPGLIKKPARDTSLRKTRFIKKPIKQ